MCKHLLELNTRGWTIVSEVYSTELIDKINLNFEKYIDLYIKIQKEQNIDKESVNAFHHTCVIDTDQLSLINPNPLHLLLESYFEGKYILNNFSRAHNIPNQTVYTQNIHRDIRSCSFSYKVLLNTLIMLDDSTELNGATWILENSQNMVSRPDEAFFFKNAVRAFGKKGDVLLFDGNLWHCGGVNCSNEIRRIQTLLYTIPSIKQGLDYPRAFGYDFIHTISNELKQVLGYNALVPTNLTEYYKPREKRFYKQDQG